MIDTATAALSDGGPALAGPAHTVTFRGRASVTVPAGGETWSDPVRLATEPQQDVAVSLYLADETTPGEHISAFRNNYLTPAGSGDHTRDSAGTTYTATTTATYVVSAVDVANPRLKGTIVAFGSSVVDGTGSTNCGPGCTELGTNRRWTDVLALHGVTAVLYYYGTNDLANACGAQQILDSYRAVFARLHDAGVTVYVTPITPRPGYSDQNNLDRHAVGTFVKHGNNCAATCDGSVDFDQVLEDPLNPNSILPKYDTGDGIHANIAGQQALADYISLPMITN